MVACSKLPNSIALLGSCLDTRPRHVLYKGGALRFDHVVCTFPKKASSPLFIIQCPAWRSEVGVAGSGVVTCMHFCIIVSR